MVSSLRIDYDTESVTLSILLQQFLSQLYVYLVDEMHMGLSKASSDTEPVSQQPSLHDNDKIKHFAEEAVVCSNSLACECIV